jgi:phosphomannomutase
MPRIEPVIDSQPLLAAIELAATQGKLSTGAVVNLRGWLTEPRYAEYAPLVAEHVARQDWPTLDDVFWTVIPFGTGGRRGRMYPIGSNAINDRTIGESAQGLAEYVKEQRPTGDDLRCAIAYDTRHRSRHFAQLCAEVMAAAGFTVCFLDGHRGTPELSFAVRHFQCACGIMVTASHNPPSDNAVKAYWSNGGQLLPPHDQGVIERVMRVGAIERVPFNDALAAGRVIYCQAELDAAYIASVSAQALGGPRDLKVLYSPLHGVGATSVVPVLAAAGFTDVEVFGPHAAPDGDFPNVPGHVANPENPAVLDALIARGREGGFDLALATDPDADRLGCAAPLTPGGPWHTLSGNQIGALLTEYALDARRRAGTLSPDHYVVKTLVTSDLVRRIADSHGARTRGDLLVGFKWIGGAMDEWGTDRFVLGVEESHGYLAGDYARDKDAAVAALLLTELAAREKAAGRTLHQKLDALFWQHGCHAERTVSKTMPGSEGMARMLDLMRRIRQRPPATLAGMGVSRVRDYERGVTLDPQGASTPLIGPRGDLVILDLAAEGNHAAVRPSGTEPKVKFYLFAHEPAEMLANLDDAKSQLELRLDQMERDLSAFAEGN